MMYQFAVWTFNDGGDARRWLVVADRTRYSGAWGFWRRVAVLS